MNYIQFTQELNGFDYFDKRSNNQVFRWQLFASGLTPTQVFDRFRKVKREDFKAVN